MSHHRPPRRIVPDAAKAATCEHRRTADGLWHHVRGDERPPLKQTAVCLECGCAVERFAVVASVGPWRLLGGRARPRHRWHDDGDAA